LLGTAEALKACVYFSLPQTASFGARWIYRDATGAEVADMEVDVRWEDWSAVSDYRVVVDGQTTLVGEPLHDSIIKHGLEDVISVRIEPSTGAHEAAEQDDADESSAERAKPASA